MTELISTATATAHPGRLEDLVRELRARIGQTRAQHGCHSCHYRLGPRHRQTPMT
jgi:hypothetical protein